MSAGSLSPSTLAGLPVSIGRPDYDIGAVTTGIVHLGLGAFHRAHQAVYTDAILHRHPGWGICGVSLKTPRVIAALTPQDGLYTVLEKGAEGTSARVIGSVREMLFLGTERDRGRQSGKRRQGQPFCRHATPCGCSLTRDTSCVGLTKRSAISSHTSVTTM